MNTLDYVKKSFTLKRGKEIESEKAGKQVNDLK